MNKFDIYISLTVIVKIIYIILAISRLYIKYKKPNAKKLLEEIELWKKRVEFVFIIMMSALLIYLFNPRKDHLYMIDKEAKILLYLYGVVMLFIATEKI